MASDPTTGRVAVLGGGVIGLACAWRLALAGVAVSLVDHAPGRGASWAAAGMLAPVTEAHVGEQALLRLTLAAAERWPVFAAELDRASGHPCGYRRTGTLVVARDADDDTVLRDLLAALEGLGLQAERLTSTEVRAAEPALAPTVRSGLLVEGDHAVDNRALVNALLAACVAAGVDLIPRRAAKVATSGGRVSGLWLEGGGKVDAVTVVVAAGWASGALAGLPPDALPPVRPVKGQLLHLRGGAEALPLERTVRGLDVYVVPRGDGRIVVGATVEERGVDTRTTVEGVYDLLRAGLELLPALRDLELAEVTVGLRPGSPDNAPLIGHGALPGLVLATGHHRNGILLAPVTADAIVALLTTGTVPSAVAAFDPQRFAAAPAEVVVDGVVGEGVAGSGG